MSHGQGFAPIAVDLLVHSRVQGVVERHQLLQTLVQKSVEMIEPLIAHGALLLELRDLLEACGELNGVLLGVLEENEVVGPLSVPEIRSRNAHEGTEDLLERHDEATEEPRSASLRERDIVLPQPSPVDQIPGGIIEEILDGRIYSFRSLARGCHALPGPGPLLLGNDGDRDRSDDFRMKNDLGRVLAERLDGAGQIDDPGVDVETVCEQGFLDV